MLGINKQLDNNLRVSLDWISFTVTSPMELNEVLDFLGYKEEDFRERKCGGKGYKDCIEVAGYNLLVYYNGNENMGIHVAISGASITNFFVAFRKRHTCKNPFNSVDVRETVDLDFTVFVDFVKRVLQIGHFTRLDLAVDDIGAYYFSVEDLVECLNLDFYTSRFKSWTQILNKNNNGNTIGHTVNLGSRTSDIFMRVYDKRLEQNAKLEVVNAIKVPWVRWEIELKGIRVEIFLNNIVSGMDFSTLTIGVISYYLRLINRDNVRKSRCSTLKEWENFLNGISSVSLSFSKPALKKKKKKRWLKQTVAPTFYAVMECMGSIDYIYDLLEYGSLKQNSALRDMVKSNT